MRSSARHPKLIPLLTAYTVRDAVTLRVYELLADAQSAGGFGAEASLAAITVLDSFVLGSALDAAAPAQVWEAGENAAGPWREALEAGLGSGAARSGPSSTAWSSCWRDSPSRAPRRRRPANAAVRGCRPR